MTPDPTEYHRNKALGNTWHVPTATWLLFLLLLQTLPTVSHGVTLSPLQHVTQLWLSTKQPFGPPPKDCDKLHMPQYSWTQHLSWTQQLDTSRTPKQLDHTLTWCVQHSNSFHPLTLFRQAIVDEITDLIEQMVDDTASWFQRTPPQIQLPNKFTAKIAQVPMFSYLLRLNKIRRPAPSRKSLPSVSRSCAISNLASSGTSAPTRSTSNPRHPTIPGTQGTSNRSSLSLGLTTTIVSCSTKLWRKYAWPHERSVSGTGLLEMPHHLPSGTSRSTILPIPHAQPYTALAFSIQQVGSNGKDNIRRGEDWRRSGHNSTCTDQPVHHTPDHFASLALLDHSRWPH